MPTLQKYLFALVIGTFGAFIGLSTACSTQEPTIESIDKTTDPITKSPTEWWDDSRQKPPSWYRSTQGLLIADYFLSQQGLQQNSETTCDAIRFLGRAYSATQDESYLNAIIQSLNVILETQTDNGDWPPPSTQLNIKNSQGRELNNNFNTHKLALLQEVSSSNFEFRFLNGEIRKKTADAFDKGIQFILNSQIIIDGKRTAWPSRFIDLPLNTFLAPERRSLDTKNSIDVIRLLMSINKPNENLIEAIESAMQWYRDSELKNAEISSINNPHDNSRLNRDTEIFELYEQWKYALPWATQLKTNTDEEKVEPINLPNPLQMSNGEIINSIEQWELQRRAEIISLFEKNQHGITPKKNIVAEFKIVERDKVSLNGKAFRTQARIQFPEYPNSPVIRVLLYTPVNAMTPVPTLLHLSFSPNLLTVDEPGIDEGMAWSSALKAAVPDRDASLVVSRFDVTGFIENGFGVALVYSGDIAPDFDHNQSLGIDTLFNKKLAPREADEWGRIGQWSWGLSRVLDYLLTEERVETDKIALSGMSRLGKTVLWAGAQDQRFALVMPMMSGEGGAAISRRNYGETIADLSNPRRYDYWYSPRYADFAFNVDALPVDGHFLVSLIAPRPILQIVATEDSWSDPYGEWLSAQAASPVYDLYGLSSVKNKNYPAPDNGIVGDMGFFVHAGRHDTLPIDFEKMIEFMHHHFDKND